jgi:hypothetical protein
LEPSLRDLWDLPDVEPWLVLAAVELGLELGYK